MTDLTEVSEFTAGVLQLETTTPALGGPGAVMNEQAQALANRTKYLNDQIAAEIAARIAGDVAEAAARNAAIAAANAPVVIDSGVAYTVLAADKDKYRYFDNAAAKTITVQAEATQALPSSAEWHFNNAGVGLATFTPDPGVTINPPKGGTLILEQYDVVTLKRIAANLFQLFGSTTNA